MKPFEDAKWIWGAQTARADEYCEFLEELEFHGKEAVLNISADSNYAVYINGSLAAFGQYADFPYDKVYDERNVTNYMRQGKNILAIRVWYYGIDNSQTYYPGAAGVIYSLFGDGVLLAASSSATLSRLSPAYVPYEAKRITNQIGLTFKYNANLADGWLLGAPDDSYPFTESYETGVPVSLRKRTCKPTEFGETVVGAPVSGGNIRPVSEHGMIFDFGKEVVGFICIELDADSTAALTVAFGEHVVDGHVRRLVGGRDFSFVYLPTVGKNYYMNPYRRFGCRFVELIADEPIRNVKVSMRTVVYPVTVLDAPEGLTDMQRRIYDACVYTMQCCMHEHYEDCPWREQALYAMDSRNQMLSGYYAFGEYLFPKSNLELIAADNRPDGLLSICYPISGTLAIPSFSLHFITESEEYLRYSGDKDFVREKLYPKMKSVLNAFVSRIGSNGLIAPISGANMWNFYEWQDGLDGRDQLSRGYTEENLEPDIILNTLLSIALARFASVERALGMSSDSDLIAEELNAAINRHFWCEERGVYLNRRSEGAACKLGNGLAILAGAAKADRAAAVAEKLVGDDLADASLSMQCFVFDALICVDKKKYTPYILNSIEKTYTPMVELGNGTVWETVKGESDFGNAGSLCHGWSAIPVYYYSTILRGK